MIHRAALLALLVLAVTPAAASAHATLEGTVPERGAQLKSAPAQNARPAGRYSRMTQRASYQPVGEGGSAPWGEWLF